MSNNLGTREINFSDWTGRVNANGIKAIRLAALRPIPIYDVVCMLCHGTTRESHRRMEFATCKNSACGQPVKKPSRLELERAAARERDRLAEEAARRHAEIRMAEDVGDWERPTRYSPKPSTHQVMTHRQRLERKARSAELGAAERAEREERERPVREAVEKLNRTHREIAALEREVLTNPKVMDPDFFHDPECDGLDFLTAEGIGEWNAAAFRNWIENHRETFAVSDNNLSVLNAYFAKHRVLLFTHAMLESVYSRMIACGIQFDAPEAEPEVTEPVPYTKRPQANLTVSEAPAKEPQVHKGIDPDTGLEREYTSRQIDRMSSEEYRTRFPVLQTVSELFTSISMEREKQS